MPSLIRGRGRLFLAPASEYVRPVLASLARTLNPKEGGSVVSHFRFRTWKTIPLVVVLAIGATAAAVAIAGPNDPKVKSEHWGVIDRNTIGDPVAELRDGPATHVIGTNIVSEPPLGKGSLGIEVGNNTSKVSFGDEEDFYGQPVQGLNAVGYYVFRTGEDSSPPQGNANNLPNITFEINPGVNNASSNPIVYTSMVWVPDGTNIPVNQWSDFVDATTNGQWYFTGSAGTATSCNQTTMCSFSAAKSALGTNGTTPSIYTVAVAKGRDNAFQGAVDGLRINSKSYDFEAQPEGVKEKDAH